MSHIADVRVGDIGTEFRLQFVDQDDAPINISGATVKFYFTKSNGVTVEKNATLGSVQVPALTAVLGWASYTAIAGDIDMRGVWFLEGWIDLGTPEWSSAPIDFMVEQPRRP